MSMEAEGRLVFVRVWAFDGEGLPLQQIFVTDRA
jgi:hypothetical protein